MALLSRANEQSQTEWVQIPEGVWRWVVGTPELKLSEKFGNYQVRFPLELHPTERKRLTDDFPGPPPGKQQSYRTSYTTGLSLGYVQRDGQYKSTKLIDFLSACFGKENTKKFRDWVATGGGPPRPADKDDQQAELAAIGDWLKWWEGLEVYGTISHADDAVQAGVVWARFAGPMAVGSLPGQKDPDYQAHGRGKLRAMLAEAHPELANAPQDKPKRTYDEVFEDDDGKTPDPNKPGDGSPELPF